MTTNEALNLFLGDPQPGYQEAAQVLKASHDALTAALEKLAETQHVANFHNSSDWRTCKAVTCKIASNAIASAKG